MDISNQLRIILALLGVVVLAVIYFSGRRSRADTRSMSEALRPDGQSMMVEELSRPLDMDEDELDTPAYMRRQPHHVVQFEGEPDGSRAVADPDASAVRTVQPGSSIMADEADRFRVSDMRFETEADEPVVEAPDAASPAQASSELSTHSSIPGEPMFVVDASAADATPVSGHARASGYMEEPTIPSVSEVVEPVVAARSAATNVTPTLSQTTPPVPAVERSARPAAAPDKNLSPAARRKIVALRLAIPERVDGERLQSLFQSDHLEYGRFSIFHRLHGNASVFSVASMVEPGTFDPDHMAQRQFPGVTFFMLLPGPLDGLVAWDQMLSVAQRLAHATGGELQDERGKPLTTLMMDRLREEVLDFQHLMGSAPTA